MPTLGEAIYYLRGDSEDLDQTMAKADKDTQSWSSKINGFLSEAGSFVTGTIISGGVTAIAGAVSKAGSAVLDFASQSAQSVNEFQAQLGVSQSEATTLGQLAKTVFAGNWGESLEDVTNSLITVRQQMKGLSNEDLQAATQSAIALKDVFGKDIPETTNAANTLMQNFGLSQQQAFDFITKGIQSGLDTSGDFLDTIGEYSTQFANGGANAEQFFSLMQSGLQGGVLGTDKAADAFKEFRIRIMDGSETTNGALASIGNNIRENLVDTLGEGASKTEMFDAFSQKMTGMGIDVENFRASFESGSSDINTVFRSSVLGALDEGKITAADAFGIINGELGGMNDTLEREALGVSLFGTQWEDLGTDAALALNMTNTKLDDMAGATDSLNAKYNNFPSLWEGFKREALVALEPVGAGLLSLANDAMPVVKEGFGLLKDGITFAANALSGFVTGIRSFLSSNSEVQGGTTVWNNFLGVVQSVATGYNNIVTTVGGAVASFWDKHGSEISAKFTQYYDQVKEIFNSAIQLYQAVVPPILNTIAQFISDHGSEISLAFKAAWDIISALISTALGLIQGIIKTVTAAATGDWKGFGEGLVGIARTLGQGIYDVIEGALNLVLSLFNTNLDQLEQAWTDGWNGIVNTITSKIGEIESNINGFINRALQFGENIIDSISQGVMNAAQGLIDSVVNAVNDAYNAALNALGMHSPSTLYLDVGRNTINSIRDGVVNALPGLLSTLHNVTDEMIDQFHAMIAQADTIMAEMFGGQGSFARQQMSNMDFIASLRNNGGDAQRILEDLNKAEEDRASIEERIRRAQEGMSGANSPEERARAEQELADAQADQAENSARILELQRQQNQEAYVRNQLTQIANQAEQELNEATARAAEITDPREAAEYLQIRSTQIREMAELQRDLAQATSAQDRERIEAQMRLLQSAQAAEMQQYILELQAQQEGEGSDIQQLVQAIQAWMEEGEYRGITYQLNVSTVSASEQIIQDFLLLQAIT